MGAASSDLSQFSITNMDVVGVDQATDQIRLSLGATLFNSGSAVADLGQTQLSIERDGVAIGVVQGLDAPLVEGDNALAFDGVLQRTPENSRAVSEVMSLFLSGLDTEIVLRSTENITNAALLLGSSMIEYGSTTLPYDMMWKDDATYKDAEACANTGNHFAIESFMVLSNPFAVPVAIESGLLDISLQNAPEIAELDDVGQYAFSPPYDKTMYLGYSSVENVVLPPSSASRSPYTTLQADICIDGILDCGCEYQAPFLQNSPFGPVSGCPIVPFVSYADQYLGIGGAPNPPGIGRPGNARAVAQGNFQTTVGDCSSAEGCISLGVDLTQAGINLAFSVDWSSADFGCLF